MVNSFYFLKYTGSSFISTYGTVMKRGVLYYRTRIKDANGKLVAIYAKTPEELYNKETFALEQINLYCSRQRTIMYSVEVHNGLYDTKRGRRKWGVTPRRVNYYCAAGRIPGAVKMAGVWLIPKNAEKPIDGRTKQGKGLHHE